MVPKDHNIQSIVFSISMYFTKRRHFKTYEIYLLFYQKKLFLFLIYSTFALSSTPSSSLSTLTESEREANNW